MSNLTRPHFALRIALIYTILSALWILLSDRAMALFAADPAQLTQWQTWKGWGYTGVIAVILYVLLRREARWHQYTEETLRRQNDEYYSLAENIPDIVARFDRQLRCVFVNQQIEATSGIPADAFVGKIPRELNLPLEVVKSREKAITQVFESGQAQNNEFTFPAPTGLSYFEQRLIPELGPTGVVQTVLAINRNITQRKQAEAERKAALEALRESEEKFRSFIEQSSEGMVLLDEAGRVIEWNQAQERITGIPRAEALNTPFWNVQFRLLPPEHRLLRGLEAFEEALRDAFRTGQLSQPDRLIEVEIQTVAGERKIIQQTSFLIKTADGYWIGAIFRDITARKHAEETLHLQSAALNAAANAIAITDHASHVRWINPAFTTLTGYTVEETAGKTLPELLRSGQEDSAFYAELDQAFAAGRPWRGELTNRRKDGSLYIEEQIITPVRDERGEFRHMIAIKQDITARKQAEFLQEAALRALHDSEERFRRALANIPDVVVIYNGELRVQYVNAPIRQLTEQPVANIIGQHDEDIWPPQVYQVYHPVLQEAAETRRTCSFETKVTLAATGTHYLQITFVPLLSDTGEVRETLGILHDYTEREQAAEALRQYAERLKILHAVGRAGLSGQLPQAIAELTLDLLQQLVPYQRGTITWISTQTQEAVGITKVIDRPVDAPHAAPLASSIEEQPPTIHMPLFSHGKLIGTLRLQADQPAPFTAQDVEIAREAADELALAIQHTQLFEQVKTGRDRMEILSRRLLDVQETERRAIARELHDEIGQALTALKIDLQILQPSVPAPAVEQLAESIRIVDRALQQVRDLSLDLRPPLLDDLGLPAALRWYVDRQAQRGGLIAELNVDTLRERLAPELETVCFRVVQEAVTNTIRHAHAQRLYVELIRREEHLLLTIQDDGRGFEVSNARAKSGTSLGLRSMEERVWLSGGELEIESTPGRGTIVQARLSYSPLQ